MTGEDKETASAIALAFLIILLIAFTITYLVGAFAAWDLVWITRIGEWTVEERLMLLFGGIFGSLLLLKLVIAASRYEGSCNRESIGKSESEAA